MCPSVSYHFYYAIIIILYPIHGYLQIVNDQMYPLKCIAAAGVRVFLTK